jgi:hypothetical protein
MKSTGVNRHVTGGLKYDTSDRRFAIVTGASTCMVETQPRGDEMEAERKIFQQLEQISRQLGKLQMAVDKLLTEQRREEPGLVQGIRRTRLVAKAKK